MAFQHSSEEFVFKLCHGSFLSLWSNANPLREGSSDELCNILVVCDPHVLIFSVKYSAYREPDDPKVGASRWLRKTVDASIRQVYGAERNLAQATHVTRSEWPAEHQERAEEIKQELGFFRSMFSEQIDEYPEA